MLDEFNIKKLREFTNDKQGIIISTLHLLSETLADDSRRLSNALENKDLKKIKSAAHKMKPNLDLIGYENLRAMCENIQTSDEPIEELESAANNIIKAMPRILSEIDTELNNIEI